MTGTSRLLERGAQLDVLDAALASAAEGAGRMVLVEGAAGTGKTALLGAAAVRAPGRGLHHLGARGSEIEQEFAFGVIRQLFEPPLMALPNAARRDAMAGPVRPAERVVLPAAGEQDGRAPEEFAVLHAIHLLLARLASDHPLLLCVDDAHWADPSSLRALSYTAGRIAGLPVALVVSLRPEEPGAPAQLIDQLRSEPSVERMPVAPLGPASVARLVRERLPDADEDACRAAAEASAGNALYLTELLRAVAETGGAGGVAAEAIGQAALPSLGDRVTRRIARVDPAAPALTAAMAVLGDGGSVAMAAEIAGIDLAAAGAMAHRLRRIEVLAAEDPFAFVHPLVRRSVYDAQPVAERDALHGRAAELLEAAGATPQAVAAHVAAVAPRGSVEAATALTRAGGEAAARGAGDEAMGWYQRALDEGAPEPPRAELLAELGAVQFARLDPSGVGHLVAAMDGSPSPELRARVATQLAPALIATGRWDEAADVIEAAQHAQEGDTGALAAELAAIGLMAGNYSRELRGRLRQDPKRMDVLMAGPSWQASGLAAMRAAMAAHHDEPPARIRALIDRAMEGDLLVHSEEHGIWAASHVLVALAEIDENERGLAFAEEVLAASERDGLLLAAFGAGSHAAWIHSRRGDLARAAEIIGPQLAQANAAGNATFAAAMVFYVEEVILERSGSEPLREQALTVDLEAAGLAGTMMEAMVRTVRGRLRGAAMEHAEAVTELRTALEIADDLGAGPRVAPFRSLLALALPSEARAEALALVEEELRITRAGELDRPLGIALRAAGVLGEPGEGEALLRESVERLAACDARIEEARSRLALGSALRRAGSRTAARESLTTAVDLAHSCGADLLAARAREELTAAGARPRRVAATGPAALTPSELRVAKLAAGGATNSEIAHALVVSPKTVETHITHVYAKLGMSGPGARQRLAEAIDQSSGVPPEAPSRHDA